VFTAYHSTTKQQKIINMEIAPSAQTITGEKKELTGGRGWNLEQK